MHDPIADMLTRIRNAQSAKHLKVKVQCSKIKEQIAKVLKEEGYILDYTIEQQENNTKTIIINLKYYCGRPAIDMIRRISRPGLRIYKAAKELLPVPGFGIAVLTTSKGVMTNLEARKLGLGGELLCELA